MSANAQTGQMIGLFDAMSILIPACPSWVIPHVTVRAVDASVALVNPWIHPLDPLHVLVVVLTAVPVGGLADWAGVRLNHHLLTTSKLTWSACCRTNLGTS